jgi:hypothetical protein
MPVTRSQIDSTVPKLRMVVAATRWTRCMARCRNALIPGQVECPRCHSPAVWDSWTIGPADLAAALAPGGGRRSVFVGRRQVGRCRRAGPVSVAGTGGSRRSRVGHSSLARRCGRTLVGIGRCWWAGPMPVAGSGGSRRSRVRGGLRARRSRRGRAVAGSRSGGWSWGWARVVALAGSHRRRASPNVGGFGSAGRWRTGVGADVGWGAGGRRRMRWFGS